ncbi:FadR/GntR family transcriptional regulator [Glycomyces terrestris]|uniref:FadR family transcriptional regulator n=1 Tax=Glycomyces terrestris TaxID=2493553 RepID=A0A426UT11_9ACTN|nr:FCD domain-containing protein [Glycomyces terrestris]RRR96767.1 FadR family transcriptional regulator [Glycomyces terrestris]
MSRSDGVVNGIKRMIIEGELRSGERLPPEKRMCELLDVSRSTLREGLRALSSMGILHTRQGDGTYVTALDVTDLLTPLGFVVDLHREGRAHDVQIVRRLLESEAARLAASCITAESLVEMKDLLNETEQVLETEPVSLDRLVELDIAFHRIVAVGSGNQVLAGIAEALVSRSVRDQIWHGLREAGVVQRTHQEHKAIWLALEARDTEIARVRMANHLAGEEEALRRLRSAPGAT